MLTKKGSIYILSEGDLNVSINYDKVLKEIEKESKEKTVYKYSEDNLYFIGKEKKTEKDYEKSLLLMQNFIKDLFSENPYFDVFKYLKKTAKGTFAKANLNLSFPCVALFQNCTYYKYVESFVLYVRNIDSKNAEVLFEFKNFDSTKMDSVFVKDDYSKPIDIYASKLSAIKKSDLKIGYIYSDEKQKKYYIYLGRGVNQKRSSIKECMIDGVMLDELNFPNNEIENDFHLTLLKDWNRDAKYLSSSEKKKYRDPNEYLFYRIEKKDVEKFLKGTCDFKKFINENYFLIYGYTNPVRVFHEEKSYLTDIDLNYTYITKDLQLMDNRPTSHYRLANYPEVWLTICSYHIVKWNYDFSDFPEY